MFGREQETWVPAGSLENLPENEPTQVTLRVAREDGYREVIDFVEPAERASTGIESIRSAVLPGLDASSFGVFA